MAATTPTVRDDLLTWRVAETDGTILVGSPAWFAWLEGVTSFAYRGPTGSFTARKEQRRRGGWYWKAYRKHKGKLHRAYLGKSHDLTPERLATAASALAAHAGSEPSSGYNASNDNSGRRAGNRDHSAPGSLHSTDERPAFIPSLRPPSAAAQRAAEPPADWPRGTVTFLFTDIVNSTQLWEQHPQAMPQVLVRHDALVRAAIAAHAGVIFKTLGDALCAAFARASDALAAARAAQHALQAEDWAALGLRAAMPIHESPFRVRMALHTGTTTIHNGDYVGSPLSRVARILGASHGGQILLSHATCELASDGLPSGVILRDLGNYHLTSVHGTGLTRPERLFQLVSPDLPAEFPPPIISPPADRAPSLLSPLVATKLMPPPRTELIGRPRLIDQLRRVTEHLFTLIVAPPGFGKTTLLRAWLPATRLETNDVRLKDEGSGLKSHPLHVAWLTLDEADNDPARFWSYLIAALEQQCPGIGADAAVLLHGPRPLPIDTMLTLLVNAIAAMPGHLALVLDDFHVISAPPIQQALTTLITYLPPNFHLVIASRADVPLPLARLRARGQVAEIRATDLRCTPDEATAFLRAMLGRDLAPDDVAALLERTEGWMAGLQLAALSLQGEPDVAGQIATIRGENRYIWDYLVDEVLDRQPPAVRQFLLHSALLDRMCAELCDAAFDTATEWQGDKVSTTAPSADVSRSPGHPVSLSGSSQAMIEYLERANLFIVPLDVERRWYRYHRLFADVLRLRLRQLHPELVAPIHRRAAAWYRRSGLPTDAIQHALAAQDWDAAAEYIEESAEALLMRGEVTTLVGWIRTLPRDVLHNRPRLSLFYAAALVVIGQLDEADVYVRIAEQASEAKQTPSADSSRDDALAAGELDTIKAVVAGSRGDLSVAIACAHAALEQLPQERRLFRLAATMILGADAWMRGETNQTLQFIEAQLALHAPSGNELLHAWANMLLIYVQCSQGKLRLAAQTGWRLLAPNADRSGVSSLTAGVAAARLSEISYEWNDLEAAVRFARDGIAQSRRFGSPEQESFNSAALALALQAQGDAAGARTAIEQAVKLVQPQPIERAVVATYQVRLWLAQGDLASAVAWAQACAPFAADKIQYVRVVQQLTLARVYLAQGGAAVTQAIMLLVPLVREAESHEQFGQAIEAYALLALAHTAGDDATQAIDCLARALELAAPEGYIRLFADLGAPMAGLLRQARARGITPGYVQKLLASFSRTEGRGLRTESPESVHVMLSPQSSTLVEPLSARELEVLRLIAAGQPNGAIAQTLIIAESTVKMHLKNIYGKLDAHSRTQAIARARAVGLL